MQSEGGGNEGERGEDGGVAVGPMAREEAEGEGDGDDPEDSGSKWVAVIDGGSRLGRNVFDGDENEDGEGEEGPGEEASDDVDGAVGERDEPAEAVNDVGVI